MDSIESYASRRGVLRSRSRDAQGLIIHTTGAGPWKRYYERRCAVPSEAACRLYERSMKYSPHYLVCGETGHTTRINSLGLRAMHVGSSGAWQYRRKGWAVGKDLEWWFRRFPYLASPRKLFGGALWTQGSANDVSVGIEVSPPCAGPRHAWTDAAWESLDELVSYLTQLLRIPRDTEHVITHSDAHPLKRVTKGGAPWDPGPGQWRTSDAANRLGLA